MFLFIAMYEYRYLFSYNITDNYVIGWLYLEGGKFFEFYERTHFTQHIDRQRISLIMELLQVPIVIHKSKVLILVSFV